MFCKRTLSWGWVLASTALLAALSVYCLARLHPPALLVPLTATNSMLVEHTSFFGSAPSFFYTFAVGLTLCLCASTRAAALLHCTIWLGLSLLLELSQHPVFSGPLFEWISNWSSVTRWDVILSFWRRGVFDVLDIIATIVGSLAALTIFALLHRRTKNGSS